MEPKIAAKQSIKLELEPGTYYFCTCGQSDNQPFCNGAHKGSSFSPQPFIVEEKKLMGYCQCKHTANAPYCDGTHRSL